MASGVWEGLNAPTRCFAAVPSGRKAPPTFDPWHDLRRQRAGLLPAGHTAGEEIDPDRLVVEAGDVDEGGATCSGKILGTAHADLLEGFEAVGDEGRGDDQQALFALGGEALVFEVRVRLEPGL